MMDPLQKALKQSRPFESLPQRTIIALLRTGSVLGELMASFYRVHGLTQAQYNVLRILRGAGRAGLPSLEVAERMVHRVPDITRILRRLEGAGLVKRERCEKDRRVVFARITPQAEELLSRMDEPLLEHCDKVCSIFTDSDLKKLNELLDRFCNR